MKDVSISDIGYEQVLAKLQSRLSGLTPKEARDRLAKYGFNMIHKRNINALVIFYRQFTGNPLIMILAFATSVAFVLGQQVSSYYIFGMILLSVILGFYNEFAAEKTIDSLLSKISPTATVLRSDDKVEVSVTELTIGDIVLLSQGTIIPADLRLVVSNDLQVNESPLTGESKVIYKTTDALTQSPNLRYLANMAYMGTSVDSGSGKGVVVSIGKDTEFGHIAKSALFAKPSTEFQRGLTQFGQLLVKIIVTISVGIFILNSLLGKPILESMLFALAIAVGLTPELLPVIVTISLSHGAGKLSKKKVVAKQLIAIENLGNMDVLCTDKTGTLTEGNIELIDFQDVQGKTSTEVLMASLYCNNALLHGHIIGNGIDAAIWKYAQKNHIHPDAKLKKLDEEPFDFNRKAMFTVIHGATHNTVIVKGAPDVILSLCKPSAHTNKIHEQFVHLNNDGIRVVAVATKTIAKKTDCTWDDISGLTLLGHLTFLDVPKTSTKEALVKLKKLNIDVKIVTGDNEIITEKVCREVGMVVYGVLLGSDVETLNDTDLKAKVTQANVFARVSPDQKMRIIQALQSNGHTVGYLGDGINDVPSLRAADVGISVNTAVDVAKDAAAMVLLRKGLDVIAEGVVEGRRTFGNTIKYILMSTSSNFGNMFSAAGASFLLPFLPMTPVQILLTNAFFDVSQLSISTDNVDPESLIKPRHWNIKFIKQYMLFFGPISSVYDFLTFGIMYFVFKATGPLFQTGWFIESVATQILVVFVIRTSKSPFFKSMPSKWLLFSCLGLVFVSLFVPYSPIAHSLGFVPLPPLYFIALLVLVSTYLFLVEGLKQVFLKKYTL